jgi:hypothetical protein
VFLEVDGPGQFLRFKHTQRPHSATGSIPSGAEDLSGRLRSFDTAESDGPDRRPNSAQIARTERNQSGVVARGPRDIHHWSRAGL